MENKFVLFFKRMFGIKVNIKQENDSGMKEYSFIWHKEIKNKDTTYYTQPFRTKIKAKNEKEAKDKLIQFVLGKMKLVIINENHFEKNIDFDAILNNESFKQAQAKVKYYNELLDKLKF